MCAALLREKMVLRGEAEGQGLSASCLTSSLSSSPIGLSLPAPPAPGRPPYECWFFFSGLLRGMLCQFSVKCDVALLVWCAECKGRREVIGQRRRGRSTIALPAHDVWQTQ